MEDIPEVRQECRVPYADTGPIKIPESLARRSGSFPFGYLTGYQAAVHCDIEHGEVVAVWGCGPVGQFAIRSAYMLGEERVIAIDRVPERLEMAGAKANAEVINYEETDVFDALRVMTDGRGPDSCIDAVGMEAHGMGLVVL